LKEILGIDTFASLHNKYKISVTEKDQFGRDLGYCWAINYIILVLCSWFCFAVNLKSKHLWIADQVMQCV